MRSTRRVRKSAREEYEDGLRLERFHVMAEYVALVLATLVTVLLIHDRTLMTTPASKVPSSVESQVELLEQHSRGTKAISSVSHWESLVVPWSVVNLMAADVT